MFDFAHRASDLVHPQYAQAALQSIKRPSRRRGRHTPTGRQIAGLLEGSDRSTARKLANQALGTQLADQAIEAGAGYKHENAARTRRDPAAAARAAKARWKHREVKSHSTHDRKLVEVRQVPHAEHSLIVRRYCALLCCIFEHADLLGDNRGRAAGAGVCLGRTRSRPGGEASVYLPAAAQGGIAARLGVSVRVLEQMIAVLVHAHIMKAWQPPVIDPKTGVVLPAALRGETYAYQMYTLVDGLPAALAGHLRRWDGLDKQREAMASPARIDGAELVEAPMSRDELERETSALTRALRDRGSGPPS